jgi:hypothetical protein
MNPAQLYALLATILNISNTDAEVVANQLMALILGRATSESSYWKLTPPSQSNDLKTTEKMLTKLLNSLNTSVGTTSDATSAFNSRFNEGVGSFYEGQADNEAFTALGGNLIQVVYAMKKGIEDGTLIPKQEPSDEEKAVLESGITQEILNNIITQLEAAFEPTQPQLDAMNSGITAEKLAELEAKEFTPTTDQQEVLNSGLTTEHVTWLQNMLNVALTTIVDASSTDQQIATAKAVYTAIQNAILKVEYITGPIAAVTPADNTLYAQRDSESDTSWNLYTHDGTNWVMISKVDDAFVPTPEQLEVLNSGITNTTLTQITNNISSLQSNAFSPTPEQQAAMDSGITADKLAELEAKEFTPTTEQQAVLDSGITAEKLAELENKSDFKPTQPQLDAMNSGITAEKVAILDGMRPMTDTEVDSVFNTVFGA